MQVQVTVLEIDKEREKVSLGMKTGQQLPSKSQTPRSAHATPQLPSPAEKAPDT
jgi:ribosomal protein S1